MNLIDDGMSSRDATSLIDGTHKVAAGPGIGGQRFDELDGGVGSESGDMAAGKAGGVAVFIVNVDLDAEALAFLHSFAPEAEPFVTKVFGHEARARMDEDSADTLALNCASCCFA
jgi:hypothetical protein